MRRRNNISYELFLLSTFFFGLAHISFLPLWEGFDETAHYSYIKQIADTGNKPRIGDAWIAVVVEEYAARGPMPYSPAPPFERNGAATYSNFFSQPQPVLSDFKKFLFESDPKATRFAPGHKRNWEVQHPPLYYALVAIVAKGIDGLSLGAQLLSLRTISYLFAFIGLCVAFYANRLALEHLLPEQNIPLIAVSAWPLVLPMWFSGMARLGNDSLSVLIMSIAWMLTLRIEFKAAGWIHYLLLGIVLGIGCWTKAFFLPASLGAGIYLFWRIFLRSGVERINDDPLNKTGKIFAFVAPFVVVGFPFYINNLLEFGSFFNIHDQKLLADIGGLKEGLEKNWSLESYIHSIGAIGKSFIWSGTWSYGRPPLGFLLPTSALVAIVVGAYVVCVTRQRKFSMLLPVFFIMPVLAALLYHALMWIAISGQKGGTGVWYLFIFAGPVGLVVALGVSRLWEAGFWRKILGLLIMAGGGFTAAVSYLQVLMYSGCAVKSGTERSLQILSGSNCWAKLTWVLDRLDVIAYPSVGIAAATTGIGLVAGGIILCRNEAIARSR